MTYRAFKFAVPLLLGLAVLAACRGGEEEGPTATATTVTATATTVTGGTTSVTPRPEYVPPHNKPGPAAERLYFQQFDVDRAALELQAGQMDIYYFSLKSAAARDLRGTEGVRLYEAPATTLSLILNPAPDPFGQLNPFSLSEVRYALQFLVNRESVAGDIFQGNALPMLTHVSPLDYDYLTVYELVRGSGIRYDPSFAQSLIDGAMTEAGAELVDGVWHYDDKPVVVKFIIRVEDERRDLGFLVTAELEKMGFQVQRLLQTFAPAIQQVYSTDPQTLGWHLYTEGWGRGAPEKFDFATINQMTAPWLGNMPGWQEVGFWQYEREDLDDLGKRLFTGDFADATERDALYRDMTELALEDSVRIWVVTVLNNFPALDSLVGVTEDVVAGPKGLWTLREAYIPGQEELTVGNLHIWTERTTWNPVGGMGDVYSVDIWRNLNDPPIWNHPATGIPLPFRVSYEVETAGSRGKLNVPSGAVLWDAEADQWQPVGAGVQATSKVTFDYSKYFQSQWHHGQPITMADVIYSIYQGYEIAYDPDKLRIEFALGVTTRPYLETFRGFRVLDENRLEVYVDFWHFEENLIASYTNPSSLSMPWEVLAAMDTLVFEKRKAAYSDTAAARFRVPWISLVLDKDARLVRNTLRDDYLGEQSVPESVFDLGGQAFVSLEEAQDRYQAAMDWFETYGLLVISNGPFKLTQYQLPNFAELQAFRDASYPFKPGDWFFGQAELVEITGVQADDIQIGAEADIRVTLAGPGTLALKYVLLDPATGELLEAGEAERVTATDFTITLDVGLTSELQAGLYTVFLAASSDAVSTLAERSVDVVASGS